MTHSCINPITSGQSPEPLVSKLRLETHLSWKLRFLLALETKQSWKARPRLRLRYGADNGVPKQSLGTRDLVARVSRLQEPTAQAGSSRHFYDD